MRVEKKAEEKLPKAEEFKKPQPLGKIFFLVILVIIISVLFWLSWQHVLNTGIKWSKDWQNIWTVLLCLLAFCLMFTIVGVAEVLIDKFWLLLVIFVLSGAMIFIFFKINIYTSLASLFLVIGFLSWKNEIRVDMKTRIKFVPRKTISAGLKSAVLFALLSVALSYYSYLTAGTGDLSDKIRNSLILSGTKAINNALIMFYKDKYNPKMTLDDFIVNTTESVVKIPEISGTNKEAERIFASSLSQVEKEAAAKAREDFLKTFKISASGDELMDKVIEKVVRSNIDKYIQPYKKFIPIILAFALFYLLYIFKFIYIELIKSFSFLIFQILAWTKFIKVKKVQVEAERITL